MNYYLLEACSLLRRAPGRFYLGLHDKLLYRLGYQRVFCQDSLRKRWCRIAVHERMDESRLSMLLSFSFSHYTYSTQVHFQRNATDEGLEFCPASHCWRAGRKVNLSCRVRSPFPHTLRSSRTKMDATVSHSFHLENSQVRPARPRVLPCIHTCCTFIPQFCKKQDRVHERQSQLTTNPSSHVVSHGT